MMSSCWQISFFPGGPAAPEFETFLEEYFEVTACNYDDNGQDEYIGYQSGKFDETDMLNVAQKAGVSLPAYKISRLESESWLKDYVIRFAPFEVADFMIYGIHEATAPETSKIPLQIYAATAFGSDHQTTRACLSALSDIFHQGYAAPKILDIGTGSGILSLAAAKLWQEKCRIIAVDIDEESVLVTRSNADNNQVGSLITAETSNGFKAPLVKQNAPYNLILANILARPLLEMAPDIAASLVPQGFCVLSGFVADQTDWILSAYQQHGLVLVKLYEFDNWRAALMKKA